MIRSGVDIGEGQAVGLHIEGEHMVSIHHVHQHSHCTHTHKSNTTNICLRPSHTSQPFVLILTRNPSDRQWKGHVLTPCATLVAPDFILPDWNPTQGTSGTTLDSHLTKREEKKILLTL